MKRKPTTFGAMAASGANVVRYICDGGITTTSCGRVITRSTERIPTCCGFPMRLASDAEAESIPVDVRGRPKKPKPAAAPTKRGIPTRRKTE